jgi:hypothetical protein
VPELRPAGEAVPARDSELSRAQWQGVELIGRRRMMFGEKCARAAVSVPDGALQVAGLPTEMLQAGVVG